MNKVATVLAYHARSKHSLDRYAAGPGTLDWEAQPKAFRDWTGTQQIALPRDVAVSEISWSDLSDVRSSAPLNIADLGSLLRLCAGLTAWKEYAGSRWSLRAHPSSGNLHPTETWLIASGVAGLEDGLYHYQNLHHALERRAWGSTTHVHGINAITDYEIGHARSLSPSSDGTTSHSTKLAKDASKVAGYLPQAGERDAVSLREFHVKSTGLWLGFSSIHWREAWKYGERAFRYCQLDLGHVLAAVCYAAVLHGWRVRLLNIDSASVANCLGLDREADFTGVESEEPEVIVALEATDNFVALPTNWQHWAGKPALLDSNPLYQWPVIEEVADATRGAPPAADSLLAHATTEGILKADIIASQVILKRRSAQSFDGQSVMPNAVFRQMLTSLLPGGSPVWNMWPHSARVHPVLMVHRVEGVAPGLYVMPRSEVARASLRTAFRDTFTWQSVDASLPLFQLVCARAGKTARTLSCHQDIATQCAVTFMMVAEFAEPVSFDPAAYRHLHWEAGMLGHVITLEAEAAGWRGTGIGCFFDDADHEVLGLKDDQFQVIYHYAIGMAVDDPRLLTLPAYE